MTGGTHWRLMELVVTKSAATTSAVFSVAVALAALGDRDDGDWATVSLDTLAVVARCNRTTAFRAIRELIRLDELEVRAGKAAAPGQRAQPSRYRMRAEVLRRRPGVLPSSGAAQPLDQPQSSGGTPSLDSESSGAAPPLQWRSATPSSGAAQPLSFNQRESRREETLRARADAREGLREGDLSTDEWRDEQRREFLAYATKSSLTDAAIADGLDRINYVGPEELRAREQQATEPASGDR